MASVKHTSHEDLFKAQAEIKNSPDKYSNMTQAKAAAALSAAIGGYVAPGKVDLAFRFAGVQRMPTRVAPRAGVRPAGNLARSLARAAIRQFRAVGLDDDDIDDSFFAIAERVKHVRHRDAGTRGGNGHSQESLV